MGFIIPEDGILQNHHRENLKSYVALTDCALKRRRNVSPLRYELGFMPNKTAFFTVTAVKTSNLTNLTPLSEFWLADRQLQNDLSET
jgi:hypothetical protein